MAGRVTQVTRRVAIAPDDAVVRASQITRRVAIAPDDAVVRATQVTRRVAIYPHWHFTADAYITSGYEVVSGDFGADAVVRSEETGSFSASAVVLQEQTGSFDASAYLSLAHEASFSADAYIYAPVTDSFDASAIVKAEALGSLTASAVTLGTASFSFTSDAYLTGSVTDTFTADAYVAASYSGDFTASAVIQAEQSGSFSSSATFFGTITDTFDLDAFLALTCSSSFSADAYVQSVGSGSFTSSAIVKGPRSGSFSASAQIRDEEFVTNPVDPTTGEVVPTTVSITINGVDITREVIFTRTEFVSQVNGQPGTCRITVIDSDRVRSFTTGHQVYVKIANLNVWTGYVMRVKRIYPFPAFSTDERLFEIEGVDINILFIKRIVFDQANPRNGDTPMYPAYTLDTTALADLFSDYIDLSGDDIDTYSKVSSIGTINEDQKAAPIKPGAPWQETMRLMAAWLSPIWYIDPDRCLVWADVDVEDAPFALSDNPTGAEHGCQNLTITEDASAMINEILLIGAGYGSDVPVYEHLLSESSVTAHGVWQYGGAVMGVYKQATIDRIASSYINGTSTSKRGHKIDKVSLTATVFEHGLRAGHRVHVTSDVWGYDDIIPIRHMRLRWLSPDAPRYDLTLSHELDTNWTFFDPYAPGIVPPPDTPTLPPLPPLPPLPTEPETEPGGCTDEICGITDTFTRTVSGDWDGVDHGGWGTSDSGLPWTNGGQGDGETGVSVSVNGTYASMSASGPDKYIWRYLDQSHPAAPTDIYFEIQVSDQNTSGPSTSSYMGWYYGGSSSEPHFYVAYDGYSLSMDYRSRDGYEYPSDHTGDTATFAFTTGGWYSVRMKCVAGDYVGCRVWQRESSEPSSWTLEADISGLSAWNIGDYSGNGLDGWSFDCYANDTGESFAFDVDNLDVEGIDACGTYHWDNFDRTVTSGWGTSTSGTEWTVAFADNGTPSVDGSAGILTCSANGSVWMDAASSSDTVTLTLCVSFSTIPTGAATDFFLSPYLGTSGNIFWLSLSSHASYGRLILQGLDTVQETKTDWVADVDYMVKCSQDMETGLIALKVWLASEDEPSEWDLETSAVIFTGGVWEIGMSCSSSNANEATIDSLDAQYDGAPCYATTVCDDGDYYQNDSIITSNGWAWSAGLGDGAEASDQWSISGGALSLDVIADSGIADYITIESDPILFGDLFTYITGGSFTITGTFVLPYDLTPVSGGETAQWSITVQDSDGTPHVALTVSLGGHPSFAGRITLWGQDWNTGDTAYPGAISAGTYYFSLTVTSTGALATVAGQSFSITESFDISQFDRMYINMGQAPYANTNLVHGGEFLTYGLQVERSDQTPPPWCSIVPTDGAEEGAGEPTGGFISEAITYAASLTITLSHPYVSGTVLLTINGLMQTDFVQTSPNTGVVTLGFAPTLGQLMIFQYLVAS